MDDLSHLDERLTALLYACEPAERKALAVALSRHLRKTNAQRIAQQQAPDGTPFAPRKPRLRDKKQNLRKGMFNKLRKARYLKLDNNEDAASITFAGPVQRIARVHHLGLRDRVDHTANAPVVRYPARPLLGFAPDDITTISQMIMDHLAQ